MLLEEENKINKNYDTLFFLDQSKHLTLTRNKNRCKCSITHYVLSVMILKFCDRLR